MSDDLVASELPTFGEKLAGWLGFKLPVISLPQTAKNLDKALGRLIAAGGANLASRWERGTELREAKTKADLQVIGVSGTYLAEHLSNEKLLAERAIEFTFSESVLKQKNREKIAQFAVEDLNAKPELASTDALGEIDDDWLNQFSEFASRKSQNDIQSLWGRILSGKIRNPSSISLQSIQLLSALDSSDANLSHKVISRAINGNFIFKSSLDSNLSDLITCESLGVLVVSAGMLNQSFNINPLPIMLTPPAPNPFFPPLLFKFSGAFIKAQFSSSAKLEIPGFMLTRFGRELYQLSESFQRNELYENEFIEFLKSQGASVQRLIGSGPMENVL